MTKKRLLFFRNICIFISLFLLSLFLSQCLFADKPAPPKIMGASSPNGNLIIRVIPGEKAKSVIYQYNSDKNIYQKIQEFKLINDIYPMEVVITDDGIVYTFDELGSAGFKHPVIKYSPSGRVLEKYTLEELYSGEDLKRIRNNRTVSNIWWRLEGSVPLVNGPHVIVRDSIGGYVCFNKKGGFKYYPPDK